MPRTQKLWANTRWVQAAQKEALNKVWIGVLRWQNNYTQTAKTNSHHAAAQRSSCDNQNEQRRPSILVAKADNGYTN